MVIGIIGGGASGMAAALAAAENKEIQVVLMERQTRGLAGGGICYRCRADGHAGGGSTGKCGATQFIYGYFP